MIKQITILLFLSSIFLFGREVKVGIYDLYPASFMNKDGEIKGIYIDIINDIAKQNNWKVDYQFSSFNETINKLRKGEIDLVPGLVKTDERLTFLDYSEVTLLSGWSSFNYNRKYKIKSIKDLSNKRIALIKNDVNNEIFMDLLNEAKVEVHIKYYNEFSQMLPEIKNDSIVGGIFRNLYFEWTDPDNIIIPSPIRFPMNESHFCVPKNTNEDILIALDQEIEKWKKDKDSPYYTILNKWLNNNDNDYFTYIVLFALVIIFITFSYFLYKIYKKRK